MQNKQLLFVLLILFFSSRGIAQADSRTLTGIVTTEHGTPIEGVSVQIKGKRYFSGSQADGIYYIPVKESDSVLVFRYAGYNTQEVKITGEREYNISLRKKTPQFASSFR
ncbi:MAG: carboxypeptidase-like regulatory domain-containing protein [Chitinophagaceae bacterium]|nr:carboxypeptidase-like regulatory domain-containing protein [Chitinophagaceae bacterium]